MRKNMSWNMILSLIVGVFFFWQGIVIFQSGQYAFAIIWLLLTGTVLIRSIQGLLMVWKQRNRNEFEYDGKPQDTDVYGHRTSASYEKERLRKLDDLYQSGLLSKTEYDEKRKEIIDHI